MMKNGDGAPHWWGQFNNVLILVFGLPIVVAGASAASTWFTSWLNERVESSALAERLDVERTKMNLKYLDLALQPELGIERRTRIIGYLAAVLEPRDAAKAWAEAEARKTEAVCKVEVADLQQKLGKAIDDSVPALTKHLSDTPEMEWMLPVQEVLWFRRRIQEIEDK